MGIFSWIFRDREKKRKEAWEAEWKGILEQKKFENQIKQKHFDLEIEIRCKEEVRKWFYEWRDSKIRHEQLCKENPENKLLHSMGHIYLRDWNKGLYMIYNEETAKYKEKGSLDRFRENYLKELKELNNIE